MLAPEQPPILTSLLLCARLEHLVVSLTEKEKGRSPKLQPKTDKVRNGVFGCTSPRRGQQAEVVQGQGHKAEANQFVHS